MGGRQRTTLLQIGVSSQKGSRKAARKGKSKRSK